MTTYAQERETEQIIGVVTGIVQKGPDRWQAVVLPDSSQYNKNLWTKDQNVVAYLTSQIGNRLAFLCNASHWTRNDGQPVRSLWIDQVGSPTVGSPALAGPPQQPQGAPPPQPQAYPPPAQPLPQQQPVATPMVAEAPSRYMQEKAIERPFIHRQTASKVAAIMLGNYPQEERTRENFYNLCEQLVAYYERGMQPETLDDLMNRAMPKGMGENHGDAPPPHGDEDIPF